MSKSIKILVCYYKKDILFKNDILCPIHCGRAVAKQASKDGVLDSEEYQWMLDNMIGDDTGDNISNLNREVNEMTAIYWAWKNYDKLGNPDYIGLCHYRRLFNFANHIKFSIPFSLTSLSLLDKTGNNYKCISKLLDRNDFICRTPIKVNSLILSCLKAFQKIANLSTKYHPILYKSLQTFLSDKDYYCNSMFVMKREDFFAYCEEIFPLMFDFLNNFQRRDLFKKHIKKFVEPNILNNYKGGDVWLPRLCGFFMEYVSNFFFIHLMNNKNSITCNIINTEEKNKFKTWWSDIFSINKVYIKSVKYKIITILGFDLKIKKYKYKQG